VIAMQWELIVALVIAVPIILFPVAYVWYMNIGGVVAAIKEARAKRAIRKKEPRSGEEALHEQEYVKAVTTAIKEYPWR
jgi:hypothetical protein